MRPCTIPRFPGAAWCLVRVEVGFLVGLRFDHLDFFLVGMVPLCLSKVIWSFSPSFFLLYRYIDGINPLKNLLLHWTTTLNDPYKEEESSFTATWHYQLTFFSGESEQKFCDIPLYFSGLQFGAMVVECGIQKG